MGIKFQQSWVLLGAGGSPVILATQEAEIRRITVSKSVLGK
jgi:hypothetical protein